MRILSGSLATLAIMLVVTPPEIRAQAPAQPNLLTFGIVGSTGDAPARLNPTMQLDHLAVQRLVLAAAQNPRDRRYVDSALTGTGLAPDDLVMTDLLQLRDGRYAVGFSLFTRDDVVRMWAVAEAEARTLADAYLARRADIESMLRQYDAPGVDPRMVSYVIIGCFSLDWDGLDLTAERGYRAATRPHPGGGSYGVWAEERGGLSLRGIY